MADVSRKILDSIDRLDLDLSGKVVLTEAASGPYCVTAILAALAGAEVYAFTKTTKYGTVEQVKSDTLRLLSEFGERKTKLEIIDDLSTSILERADIITNSGHLRPLNDQKLRRLKQGAVISLMYEAWEYRAADIDLAFCKTRGLPVGAINERHPDVDVFSYLGDMALKMILDAGLCLNNNRFMLICNNDFGPYIARVLAKLCELAVCDRDENKSKYDGLPIDWIGNFPDFSIPEKYVSSQAVIFTAYPFDTNWIGDSHSPIPVSKLKKALGKAIVLRFAGDLDETVCKGVIDYIPLHVPSGHMGILPSSIGFDPIIRLQSGGLKVGELMLKGENSLKNLNFLEIL